MPLFDQSDFERLIQACSVRGFTLRYRPASGAYIAQVSRDGRYVRAQSKNPVLALEELSRKLGSQAWRTWSRRPWKAGSPEP